jgi:thiamine monophosphate synthase
MKILYRTGRSAQEPELFARLLSDFRLRAPDFFEVRDDHLSDRSLLALLSAAIEAVPESKVLASARFDLALASGAAGVVLRAGGLPTGAVRRETPRDFVIGREIRTAADAASALEAGADFLLLGSDRPEELTVPIPPGAEIFAVAEPDFAGPSPLDSHRGRIAGVAATRVFENGPSPASLVEALRRL